MKEEIQGSERSEAKERSEGSEVKERSEVSEVKERSEVSEGTKGINQGWVSRKERRK